MVILISCAIGCYVSSSGEQVDCSWESSDSLPLSTFLLRVDFRRLRHGCMNSDGHAIQGGEAFATKEELLFWKRELTRLRAKVHKRL